MSVPLPGLDACYSLLREYGVPNNIIQHAETVARVAGFLAQRLDQAGEPVNIDLVEQAALLHDLDKLLTLDGGERHGALGGRILREHGYDEIAEIIERHNFGPRFEKLNDWSWEQRLVHYADKLCFGSRVVILSERMADLRIRYPQSIQVLDRFQPLEEALEQDILHRIRLHPHDLVAILNG